MFKNTFGGDRTRDHKIKSLALYHLSYEGSPTHNFGCVAQWQSIGLQILWSAVRIRLYPSFLQHLVQTWMHKKGPRGNRTPDLSHPKRESYH